MVLRTRSSSPCAASGCEAMYSSTDLKSVLAIVVPSIGTKIVQIAAYWNANLLADEYSKMLPLRPRHSINLADDVAGQFRQQRLMVQLTSFFGILSLVLASIGLCGVTAYNAGRRTTEIGVRLALGVTRAQAAGLIVRGAFAPVAIGLAVGFPLALAAGRFLGRQLYGLNPYLKRNSRAPRAAREKARPAPSPIPGARSARKSPAPRPSLQP